MAVLQKCHTQCEGRQWQCYKSMTKSVTLTGPLPVLGEDGVEDTGAAGGGEDGVTQTNQTAGGHPVLDRALALHT